MGDASGTTGTKHDHFISELNCSGVDVDDRPVQAEQGPSGRTCVSMINAVHSNNVGNAETQEKRCREKLAHLSEVLFAHMHLAARQTE